MGGSKRQLWRVGERIALEEFLPDETKGAHAYGLKICIPVATFSGSDGKTQRLVYLLVISKVVPKIWARTNSAMLNEMSAKPVANEARYRGGKKRSQERVFLSSSEPHRNKDLKLMKVCLSRWCVLCLGGGRLSRFDTEKMLSRRSRRMDTTGK